MRQKCLLLTITVFFFLATTFQWTYGQTTDSSPENADKPVEVVPGVTLQDLAEFPEDISFFIVAGGFGLLAGIPAGFIGGPVVGCAAGAAAMGTAAYRMDVNRFLRETVRDPLNEYAQREYGRDMTEEEWRQIKEKFDSVTTRHGLTKALPEAAGRLEDDRISALAIMTGSAILYLIAYISVPLIIRYGYLKRPLKTKKTAVFILMVLFIGFSYHIHGQKIETQKIILKKIKAPSQSTTPGMIGSPLLYGAMGVSYFILRKKNKILIPSYL